jgi:hypothetical protein
MHRDHDIAIWHYTFDVLHHSSLALLATGTAGSDLAHDKARHLVETLNQLDADFCRNGQTAREAMSEHINDTQTLMLNAARSMLERSRAWLYSTSPDRHDEASPAGGQSVPARRKRSNTAQPGDPRTVI